MLGDVPSLKNPSVTYSYYAWPKGYYAELLHFLYLQFYSYESSSYAMFTIMNFKLYYVYNYESFKFQKKIMLCLHDGFKWDTHAM